MKTEERKVWAIAPELIIERLTDRELEILDRVAAGARNREIADQLRVSIKTVEFHLNNIFGKLNVRSRTEAVIRAWQSGMLSFRSPR
jgi:LuxR family transcriptional regulator, maltose regulon positive regulatory protein